MACGIEVDTDVVLGLIPGQDGPGRYGVLACCRQVRHGNIEVHLHLLITRTGRPYRRRVGGLALEGQTRAASARSWGTTATSRFFAACPRTRTPRS
jgi:hypothetical protein